MIIDKFHLIKKLGKEKFTEFVVNNRNREKTQADKMRGIKGRIRFRMCEHGVWVISNYKPGPCLNCQINRDNKPTKLLDFKPYFNIGLGCYVESRQDEKAVVKARNLEESG